jgi:glycosyltransferase involved in cell wall biosynthesis
MPHDRHSRRIVVISDFCDGWVAPDRIPSVEAAAASWLSGERGPTPEKAGGLDSSEEPAVVGGYLERLPLAAVRQGLCDTAEIWSFSAQPTLPPWSVDPPGLTRRSFRPDDPGSRPFSSTDMLGHIAAFGPPDILCVWGLGVDAAILQACADSVRIYNSIDAPALRVPDDVSQHFDLVLTGAEWQSEEVERRHPGMLTAVMPVGPEFASPETFFPLASEKIYDVVYVAAAQAYKKHEVLFDALARMPSSTRALCVCGYGELGDALKARVRELGIYVDFVGPPGVGFAEVNRLMNLARIGVVCGIHDGAPAILTEYMLAGLPVLANSRLTWGLQFITPATGRAAQEEHFHVVLDEMLADLDSFRARETVLRNWSWPRTAKRFATLVEDAQKHKAALAAKRTSAKLAP